MADSVFIGWFGPIKFVSSGSSIAFGASILPETDNTYDLGSATFQWRSAYLGTSLVLADAATISWSDVVVSRASANLAQLASGDSLQTVNGQLTANRTSLGTTPGAGLQTINTTAAAVGAQQISPYTLWRGNGWKTDATAASQTVDFLADVLPVQGAAAPTGSWRLGVSINGGATTYPLELTSAGLLSVLQGVSVPRGTTNLLGLGFGTYTDDTGFHADGGEVIYQHGGTEIMAFGSSTTGPRLFTGKSFSLAAKAFINTAPTIASGFGTSPSVVASNGTAAFTVNVGTGGTATAGVITLPAATTGWIASVKNLTALDANRADQATVQTASSTTSITVENQKLSDGTALAWTASDVLQISCVAY